MLPDRAHTSLLTDMAQAIWCEDNQAFSRLTALGGIEPQRMAAGLRIHASITWQTLTRALADAVPTVASMVGDEAFSALARNFIGDHPPRHAALHDWGDELPEFLARRGASPELVAIAQLDRAWMASFFAVEVDPIAPDRLTSVSPAAVPQARLTIHPSVRFVRLADSWFEIWLARGALPQVEHDRERNADGRFVVLSRPRAHVRAAVVAPGTYRFLESLQKGASLLDACDSAQSTDSRFDLQGRLSAAFADGLITDCLTGEQEL